MAGNLWYGLVILNYTPKAINSKLQGKCSYYCGFPLVCMVSLTFLYDFLTWRGENLLNKTRLLVHSAKPSLFSPVAIFMDIFFFQKDKCVVYPYHNI